MTTSSMTRVLYNVIFFCHAMFIHSPGTLLIELSLFYHRCFVTHGFLSMRWHLNSNVRVGTELSKNQHCISVVMFTEHEIIKNVATKELKRTKPERHVTRWLNCHQDSLIWCHQRVKFSRKSCRVLFDWNASTPLFSVSSPGKQLQARGREIGGR